MSCKPINRKLADMGMALEFISIEKSETTRCIGDRLTRQVN